MQKFRSRTIRALVGATLIASCSAIAEPPSTIGSPSRNEAAVTPTTPQRRAAEEGLRHLAHELQARPNEAIADRVMAVEDYSQLRDATVGNGFELSVIDPAPLMAGKPVADCIRGTGEWRFVVFAQGQAVGLVAVAQRGGHWQMVYAGASGLAAEIAEVNSLFAARMNHPSFRFVRSLQAVADFIEVTPAHSPSTDSKPFYVPLMSARASLRERDAGGSSPGLAGTMTLSGSAVTELLRGRVRLGVRDPRFAR